MALHEGRPLLLQDLEAPSPREARARQLRANRARQKKRRVAVALTVMTLLLVTGFLVSKHRAWNLLLTLSGDQSPYADALAAYRENHDFDGVVQVRVNGTVVFEAAEGVADEEFDAPMATDSVFPVGSNSKLFVAVSLYQLQERGLVNLSEPVNAHLNRDDFANFGFPNQTAWCPRVAGAAPDSPCENVTFVQLLHMGSGIGDSFDCDNVDAARCHRTADNHLFYKGSLAPYVGVFINDPLVFKPDTNYSYANPNYYLLSYLVEKISGMRLEHYVRAMIFDKIGLNDTYYDPYSGALGIRHGYVQQYIHFYKGASADVKGERLATGSCTPYINSGAVSGSGGFRSSVSDMQRWFLDLFSNQGATSKVLTQASIRMILERVNPVMRAYGQGIGVGKLREDGWPALVNYCGGMKCAVTCMTMLFPDGKNNSSDATVVISAFSNHMHMSFADRAAFEALRPTDIMIQPDNTTTFYDDGGAVALNQALIAAYSASAK